MWESLKSMLNWGQSNPGQLTYDTNPYAADAAAAGVPLSTTFQHNPTADWVSAPDINTGNGGTGVPMLGPNGWAMPAIAGLGTLAGGWLGMKQYGLAKDQFNFSKEAFNKQYAAQQKLTNTRMRDRQIARVASNPGYQSVGDYMKENRI